MAPPGHNREAFAQVGLTTVVLGLLFGMISHGVPVTFIWATKHMCCYQTKEGEGRNKACM